MENKKLTFSHSPHVKSSNSTRKIMMHVCIALLPAVVMGIVYFGLNAFLLLAISVLSAVASEFIYLLITGKKFKQILKGFDFSSCVTGLLIGMSIGSQTPLYVPVFASAFAIIVVKMLFGGTGKNLVNPAIAGRIFVFMSFTTVMAGGWLLPMNGDPATGATTLTNMYENGLGEISNLNLLLGWNITGCIGETCKVALIAGGIYLAIVGIINIGYSAIYIAITGLMAVCLNGFNFEYFLPSILSGSLIIGAIFMATDYTTSPNTTLGNIIYFVLLGVITAVLRHFTKMEVVSFAILLMNLLVPLIDKFVITRPFGFNKVKKVKADKKGANNG